MEHRNELESLHKALQKHYEDDVKVFKGLNERMDSADLDRQKRHNEIMELLSPLSETYRTATTLGKWVMAAAVFVSILFGIILSIKALKP